MQATMMNFGDNMRVVSNSTGGQVSIGIGEIVTADIHEVHFQMIHKAAAKDTLIIIPADAKPTMKLLAIMDLMRDIATEEPDKLLKRFTKVLGPNPESLRPTRDMMRIALREVARQEVRKTMMNAIVSPPRVEIREKMPSPMGPPFDPPPEKAGKTRIARERL